MAIDPFFGTVLSGGTRLFGGLLGSSASSKANRAAQNLAALNLKQQDDYAKRGITWRARDVMHAYGETGIHPLALLGVPGPTYSPVSTASFGGSPIGDALAGAGQDISRGLHATADRELRERATEMQGAQMKLATERGQLENELLRVRIASERARLEQTSNPAMDTPGARYLVPGQGATRLTKPKLNEVTVVDPRNPGSEPGAQPDVASVNTVHGTRVFVPAKEFKERAEDFSWLPFTWFIRNYVGPIFSESMRENMRRQLPPPPKGKVWQYAPLTGEWQLVDAPKPYTGPERGRYWLNRSGYGSYRR